MYKSGWRWYELIQCSDRKRNKQTAVSCRNLRWLELMTARIILVFFTCGALTFSVRRKVRTGKLYGFHSGVDISLSGVWRVSTEIRLPTIRDNAGPISVVEKIQECEVYWTWKFESSAEWRCVAALRDPRSVKRTQCPNIRRQRSTRSRPRRSDHYIVPKSSRSNHLVTRRHIP